MKSSFTRRGASKVADSGTRSGLHGQTLVSFGLVDIDKLLEGGLPLGCLCLLFEDPHSMQHLNFLKYFLAEGIACGQSVSWVTTSSPAGGPAQFLPQQAEKGSSQQAEASTSSESGETELRIAWQYRKYIQTQQGNNPGIGSTHSDRSRSAQGTSSSGTTSVKSTRQAPSAVEAGMAREWCHTFDLTKPIGEEGLKGVRLSVSECTCSNRLSSASTHALEFLSQFKAPAKEPGSVAPLPIARGPESVGRLVLQSVGAPCWCDLDSQEAVDREVLSLTFSLLAAARETRCAVLMTVATDMLSPSTIMRLKHFADVVMELGTLAEGSDVYRLLPDQLSATALLSIAKLPSCGMLGTRRSDKTLYVIRNKRRRLAITIVDVDPDAETRTESGVSSSAASLLCAGPKDDNKRLEF